MSELDIQEMHYDVFMDKDFMSAIYSHRSEKYGEGEK